ncbi:MAG: hypothetical protein WHS87_05910 [Anaerolineales bacterium]
MPRFFLLLALLTLLTACAAPNVDGGPLTVDRATPTATSTPPPPTFTPIRKTPTPTLTLTPRPEEQARAFIPRDVLQAMDRLGMRIFTSESQVPSDARSYILFNPETRTFTLTYQKLLGVDENGQGLYEPTPVELDPQGFAVNLGFRRVAVPRSSSETPAPSETPEAAPSYEVRLEAMPLSIHPPLAHDKNGRKIDLPVFQSQDGQVFFVNPLTKEIHRLEDYRPFSLGECQSLNEFWEKAPVIPLSAVNDGTVHFAFFLNYPDLKDAEAPVYTNDRYATFKLSPTDKTAPIWYIPSDKISPFHYIWIEFNNIQDKAGENYRYAYFRQRILWEELPFGQPVLPYAFRVINPATGAKLWVAPQILYDPQNTQEAVDKPIDISDPKNVKILWVAADIANLRGDQIEFMLKVYPRFFPYNAKFTTERLGKAFTIFLTPIIYTDPKVFTDCDFVIFKSLRRDYSFSDFPGLEGLLELEGNNPRKEIKDEGNYSFDKVFEKWETVYGWNDNDRNNAVAEWYKPFPQEIQLKLYPGVPYQLVNTNLELLGLEK